MTGYLRRWLTRRGPALAVLVTLLTLVCPSTAYAIPGIGDCKDAPTPQVPGRGFDSMFGDPARIPAAEDPFAAGAKTTPYEQYGLAGVNHWPTYDLGCGGSARDPGAALDTFIGNIEMSFASIGVAFTNALTQVSRAPTFLRVFDPLLVRVPQALMQGVFVVWVPLMLAVVAVLMIARAHQQQTARNVKAIWWALLVMVTATVLASWPVEAGRAADTGVTAAVGGADQAMAKIAPNPAGTGSGAAGQVLWEAVLWRPWLTGMFGDYDSVTAQKYGPDLFKATALTWSEKRTLESDPAAGKKIVEAKQKAFTDIAGKIKDEDPDAYEHLQGKAGGRWQMGTWALVTAAFTLPFQLFAALLLVAAFLIIRFSVMLFPLVATIGVIDSMSGIVRGVVTTMLAAVVNSAIFAIMSAVAAQVIGFTMLGAGLPGWLALVITGVITVVFWYLTRPFRSLTRMVRGSWNPADSVNIGSDARRARNILGRTLLTVWATKQGVRMGLPHPRPPAPYDVGIDNDQAGEPWTEPAPPPPPPPAPAELPASRAAPGAATVPAYGDVYDRWRSPDWQPSYRTDTPRPVPAGSPPAALPAGTSGADEDAPLHEADTSAPLYDPDSGETVDGPVPDRSKADTTDPWGDR